MSLEPWLLHRDFACGALSSASHQLLGACVAATGSALELEPSTARTIFMRQMLFFGALLSLVALANAYTVVADHARGGDPLPLWKPLVWEYSSCLLVWLLVPLLEWWLAKFPIDRDNGWRSLPAHLFATAPFSLLHTEGMVLLRRLAYRVVGERYDFGPFWDNWPYEYRKDFVTYCLFIAILLAFKIYGLWLEARARSQSDLASLEPHPADARPLGVHPAGAPLGRLIVRKRNREIILDAGDIDRIDADGNYVVIHAAGQSYRLRDSLEGLAARLGAQRFARVHRAHVVNIDRILEIQPWDHGDYRILLKDGSFLNFSRRYRSRLSALIR